MAEFQRSSLVERDSEQAITALKKGACLLKYGRRGTPKFCPFRLSTDESSLIWYYGSDEQQLELRQVSRIIPGQRTPIFQRHPRPEKEYQSFSLIYDDRSLDLICKDKEEAEVWFTGLKALIARGSSKKPRNAAQSENVPSESSHRRRVFPAGSFDQEEAQRSQSVSRSRLGKVFADIVSYTAASRNSMQLADSGITSPTSQMASTTDSTNTRNSGAENFRVSLSSAVSSSSQGSSIEDFDSLGDVYIWGEGTGNGVVGGGLVKVGRSSTQKTNSILPKALESTMILDVQNIACGQRHAVFVTKQGQLFSWGEEAGGRLGHGVESDISQPKLIETLSGKRIQTVDCGDYHSCAVTVSGDLYTWGDGFLNCGLLGHRSPVSHWIPKRVRGPIDGLQVSSVSCGPWHTALLTSDCRLFTVGDGTFGALGHGDRNSTSIPREVESLKGLRTIRVACGVWHTAAVVEVAGKPSNSGQSDQSLGGKLYTWGDGDKGRLGHGDNQSRLVPESIASLADSDFSRVACGTSLTVALSSSGQVYTMGSMVHGQLGTSVADGKTPICVKGDLSDSFIEDIACGSHHVAVLTSKADVYSWGKGSSGQLGHGDNDDRSMPTLVEFFKDKQVKSIACGSNFTAVICLHKWISSADNSICSGCHNPFNFRRKRHNCYNCGLVFCNACSSRKSLKASLAPSMNKPYRVCDDCFSKLEKVVDPVPIPRLHKSKSGNLLSKHSEVSEKEGGVSRLLGNIARLSSVDSFKSNRSSTCNIKSEPSDNRLIPLQSGSVQRSSMSSKSPTSPFENSKSSVSFSVPTSKMVSRSSSPVPGKCSPMRSATHSPSPSFSFQTSDATSDELKIRDDRLSKEVEILKAQVEELTSKNLNLEAELRIKTKQLKEVTAQAADEAEKSKAAKEVIKSLAAQLKDMAEQGSEEQISCSHLDKVFNDTSRPSNESTLTSLTSPKSESSDGLINPHPFTGKKNQAQISERTIQDEPGVYITLASLPTGVNELRRVRFSRKRFTGEQAEQWWAANGTRVCEKHDIQTA